MLLESKLFAWLYMYQLVDTLPLSWTVSEGKHVCAVCKNEVENFALSRPLVKSQCSEYGVAEDTWSQDMRVCSNCRCVIGIGRKLV